MKKWTIETYTDHTGTKPMHRVVIRDGYYTVAIVDATNTKSAKENAELIVNAVNEYFEGFKIDKSALNDDLAN